MYKGDEDRVYWRMNIPWRPLFLLGAIALAAIVFLITRGGLRSSELIAAVRSDDVPVATGLLESQPDLVSTAVNPQGSRSRSAGSLIRWQGRTLMHEAVSNGSVTMAETLLAFGADLNARMSGETLLHDAAKAIGGGDANYVAMMTWLLDHGADVNARNGCEHPATAVCTSGEFANIQPARPDAARNRCPGCEHEGRTPLHAAQGIHAAAGSTLLLSRGAEVNAVDAAGRTALHVAAHEGNSDGARVLCAYGADPSQRDRNGKAAEDLARAADLANPADRYSQTGVGELAGWLVPGSGCAQVAALARPGAPVPIEKVNAAWRAYACTRDQKWCQ